MNFKRQIWLSSLLIGLSISIYAQELSIGPVASIDYDYRILDNQQTRDEYEKGLINFRAGFDIDKAINSKLAIKTGLRYLEIGYKTNEEDLQWGSENDGMGGYTPDPILPFSGTIEHVYKYLEVPINLRYSFIQKKINLYAELGLSLNYSLEEKWLESYEFNRLNLSTNVGFGFSSMISDKLSIFGMPTFRYHLSKTLKDTITENLYSLGLELGLKMKI